MTAYRRIHHTSTKSMLENDIFWVWGCASVINNRFVPEVEFLVIGLERFFRPLELLEHQFVWRHRKLCVSKLQSVDFQDSVARGLILFSQDLLHALRASTNQK
mmetsp:Transcript_9811/g.17694  ORF Transcript_9811/g.17694 Transcript_9811/m.17694 type:complete len:103 (-) Transcript_9811:263-571(-)